MKYNLPSFSPPNPRQWGSILGDNASGGSAVQAGSAGRVFIMGFYTPFPMKVDQINLDITTGSVGTSFRVGIYQGDGTSKTPAGLPLLVDSGNQDASSAGQKSVTITETTIKPGFFWVCLETQDAVVNFLRFSSNNVIPLISTEPFAGASFDQAFGALPATCPAIGNNGLAPIFTIRISSFNGKA